MFWGKGGEDLVSGGTYEIKTELRDRQTTTFDNFLRINQTPQQAEGIYRCTAVNALDGPVQEGAEITRGTNSLFHSFELVSYPQHFVQLHTSLQCTWWVTLIQLHAHLMVSCPTPGEMEMAGWLVVDSSTSRSTTAFTIEPLPALDSATRHLKQATFTSNLLSVVSEISHI